MCLAKRYLEDSSPKSTHVTISTGSGKTSHGLRGVLSLAHRAIKLQQAGRSGNDDLFALVDQDLGGDMQSAMQAADHVQRQGARAI